MILRTVKDLEFCDCSHIEIEGRETDSVDTLENSDVELLERFSQDVDLPGELECLCSGVSVGLRKAL